MPKQKLFKIMLPYCIKQTENGYVILNRKYKPIGFSTEQHITYEDYPIIHKIRISPKTAASLSWKNDESCEAIFLYEDKQLRSKKSEQDKYFKRLEHLMKLLAN